MFTKRSHSELKFLLKVEAFLLVLIELALLLLDFSCELFDVSSRLFLFGDAFFNIGVLVPIKPGFELLVIELNLGLEVALEIIVALVCFLTLLLQSFALVVEHERGVLQLLNFELCHFEVDAGYLDILLERCTVTKSLLILNLAVKQCRGLL